jgi:hypothetical protein
VPTSPLQTSFAGGELSPRLHGRVETDLYARGLSLCRNFEVLPQGPLRMRAGTVYVGEEAAAPRLIPFRVSGSAEDYVIALTAGKLRVYSRATGALVPIARNLILNGHFDANIASWAEVNASWANETMEVINTYQVFGPTTPGLDYTVRLKVRGAGAIAAGFVLNIWNANGSVLIATVTSDVEKRATTVVLHFTATEAQHRIQFGRTGANPAVYVDDVVVSCDDADATELEAPWNADQLAAIQLDGELVKNRVVLVHPNVQPQVLVFTAPNVWELYAAAFIEQPAEWGAGNWPSTIEVGFQGRQWLGATPNEPHTIWMSKAGAAFDFTPGANPGDSTSFIVSTKGALQWLRGQRVLLVGSEIVEHAVSGSSKLIAPGDVNVEDESAFGSAPLQAAHIGDQVIWVTRDRRHIRALDYDLQRNAWASRALTFLAEHLTETGLTEVHFARAPYPCIIGKRADGEVIAFTYDRAEEVLAGWRVQLAGSPVVTSGCVADGPDGSELWLAVTRAGGEYIERMPLHEVGRVYLDSAITVEVAGNELAGLGHLEGETVTLVAGGAVVGTAEVVDGAVQYEAADGTEVVVGLPFTATAVTLALNVKGGKVRNARIGVRVNDSALPKINGRREADRTPSTPQDTPEPRRTKRSEVGNRGWDDEGQVTIEQDLPLRTEILSIYQVTQAKRV